MIAIFMSFLVWIYFYLRIYLAVVGSARHRKESYAEWVVRMGQETIQDRTYALMPIMSIWLSLFMMLMFAMILF